MGQTSARALYALCVFATFLGAFLSFDVQPLVGRHLLPRLGGTPSVWATCLAFFQVSLFLGYALVHWVSTRLSARAQLVGMAALWLLPLVVGPLVLPPLEADATRAPFAHVLGFLLAHVLVAYLALAATAPLLQRWYAGVSHEEPYALYAVSNLGSLLGLLAYPLLIEPRLSLHAQARAWAGAFGVYVAAMLTIALLLWRTPPLLARTQPSAPSIPARTLLGWLALAAVPSALLVSISNHITIDVAATPLLWVLPLALYLITFIIAFADPGERREQVSLFALIACAVALPILLMPGNHARLPVLLGVPLATLFVSALVCHDKLAALRPPAAQLTLYYAAIAAGGAIGGGLVAFVAPLLFDDHYELLLSLLGVFALVFVYSRRRDARVAPSGAQRLAWLGFGLSLPVLLATLWVQVHAYGRPGTLIERSRNFFGPLQVLDTERVRVLVHGRTDHGQALREKGHERDPIAYFGPQTLVGRVLRQHAPLRPRNIAVLGLGVGTLVAYARPDDHVRFYEIDPDMLRLAKRHFAFLGMHPSHTDVVLGDGRIALEHETQRFDILVLDAFSSDAVPPHLLTTQAFAAYLRHLAPDGLLVANVSNRYLRVERAVLGSARENGLACAVQESPADRERALARARWALVARTSRELAPYLGAPNKPIAVPDPVTWTDDHFSLLSLLF